MFLLHFIVLVPLAPLITEQTLLQPSGSLFVPGEKLPLGIWAAEGIGNEPSTSQVIDLSWNEAGSKPQLWRC